MKRINLINTSAQTVEDFIHEQMVAVRMVRLTRCRLDDNESRIDEL